MSLEPQKRVEGGERIVKGFSTSKGGHVKIQEGGKLSPIVLDQILISWASTKGLGFDRRDRSSNSSSERRLCPDLLVLVCFLRFAQG